MSSEGTGSPISVRDALDLLHKLSTESIKVHAIYASLGSGVKACVSGFIRGAPNGDIWVMCDPEQAGSPFISFDPVRSVVRKYGDERSMLNEGEGPLGLRFRSILSFVFKDGSTFSVFELADTDEVRD